MRTENRKKFTKGSIVWVDLGQHHDSHLQSGRRPCLIVNTRRSNSEVYTIMPGTCRMRKKNFPVHVLVEPEDVCGVITKPTIFMAEQLMTVDESQIILKTGYIDPDSGVMDEVNRVLMRQLDLDTHGGDE